MSESVSDPRVVVPDLVLAEVPAKLWLRSGRPFWGTATRVYIPFALISGALIFVPRGPVFWGMVAAGVAAFVLFPVVVQGLLAPLERRVLRAPRREATALLQEVRQRRLVRQFAPYAWATLQEGRLHLRRGDGKAAARAFAETARISGGDAPALRSMQAQALLIADQPDQARELLQALAKAGALSASDRLHLGLALLASKGHNREALEHVEAAEQGLGGHPRALAALALALHRSDRVEEATARLEAARAGLGEAPDLYDEALVERATKLLRTVHKAQQKRVRRQDDVRERVGGDADVAAPVKPASGNPAADRASKAKSTRKAKKDERRAARRAAKADKQKQDPRQDNKGKGAKGKGGGKGEVRKVEARTAVEVRAVEVSNVAAKAEAARAAAARHDAVKAEAARAEAMKAEAARAEAAKHDAVKAEAARAEAARHEAVKAEAARAEAMKAEAARAEAAKHEAAKAEAARAEAARTEAVKAEAAKHEAVKVEAARAEAAKHEAVKAEAARAEAAKHEAVKAEAARAEAMKVEAARAEAMRAEAARVAVARVEELDVDALSVVPPVRSSPPSPPPARVSPPVSTVRSEPGAARIEPTLLGKPGADGPRMPAPPSGSSLFGSLGPAKPGLPSTPRPAVPVLGAPPVLGAAPSLPGPPRVGPPPAVPPPPRVGPLAVTAPVLPGAAAAGEDDAWASMLDGLEDDGPAPPAR